MAVGKPRKSAKARNKPTKLGFVHGRVSITGKGQIPGGCQRRFKSVRWVGQLGHTHAPLLLAATASEVAALSQGNVWGRRRGPTCSPRLGNQGRLT